VIRRLVAVAFVACAVLIVAGIAWILRPAPPAPPVARVERRAPPPPPARPTPKAEEPAPEPARRPAPRVEPRPQPAPAPTPAPVEPSADAGVLRIQSDVPGALVFIDRQYLGQTPLTAPDVKVGRHTLNVSLQGYDPVSDSIDVAPGPRDINIKFREVRLDLAMDVVHKHRIGSCQGRLVATPRGLRYETANKSDAFASPLLDIDTWEIDYLEKTLKVGLKTGKRYDLSDPAGNADRLFVFHRDLEKARERLKKGDTPAP
jgi:PEGA domain